jgi:hypothetical protein
MPLEYEPELTYGLINSRVVVVQVARDTVASDFYHAHTLHFEWLAGLEHANIPATEHPFDGAMPIRYVGRDQLHIQAVNRIMEELVKLAQFDASLFVQSECHVFVDAVGCEG